MIFLFQWNHVSIFPSFHFQKGSNYTVAFSAVTYIQRSNRNSNKPEKFALLCDRIGVVCDVFSFSRCASRSVVPFAFHWAKEGAGGAVQKQQWKRRTMLVFTWDLLLKHSDFHCRCQWKALKPHTSFLALENKIYENNGDWTCLLLSLLLFHFCGRDLGAVIIRGHRILSPYPVVSLCISRDSNTADMQAPIPQILVTNHPNIHTCASPLHFKVFTVTMILLTRTLYMYVGRGFFKH